MKIVHIGHVPLPAEHPLGPRVSKYASYPGCWVLNLAKAQTVHTSDQVEILIKVPGGKGHWTTEIEGVACHFVAVPNIVRGKTGFFFDQRILATAALKLQPDIVHAHGTEEANALAALRTGLPNILTLQGCFFIINRKIPARFFSRQWIVERLERKTIPRFRHVITKSCYIRDDVHREFPGINTHLIPNTYDSALEDLDIHQERERAIAFVGTIDPRKGFDLLVEALSKLGFSGQQLPHLHVFGNSAHPGPWEVTQLQAARVCLGSRLVLHGQIPQLEMAKTVAQCRVLVAPSREEMFGNQIIEALLVGTSVIVTDNTAMEENVRRFGNGTVFPQENTRALADAISAALDARPSNLDSRSIAREKISSYMGPCQVTQLHRQVYETIVHEGR